MNRPQRLDAELERRVLAFWSDTLDAEVSTLEAGGTVIVRDAREHAAGRRATIRTARGTVLLVAPGDAAPDPDAFVADVVGQAQDDAQFFYLAAVPPGVHPDARVALLGEEERPLLEELHRAAGPDAVAEAEVDVAHALAVGIVEDGRLVAIASLLEEGAGVVDVGVLVAPDRRRQGLGAAVVREVTRRAVAGGALVQYRCRTENESSAAVARACGFVLWGVLTVAPRPA